MKNVNENKDKNKLQCNAPYILFILLALTLGTAHSIPLSMISSNNDGCCCWVGAPCNASAGVNAVR